MKLKIILGLACVVLMVLSVVLVADTSRLRKEREAFKKQIEYDFAAKYKVLEYKYQQSAVERMALVRRVDDLNRYNEARIRTIDSLNRELKKVKNRYINKTDKELADIMEQRAK